MIRLEVSGAFHSLLMQPAAEGLGRVVSQLDFREPRVPIVVNATAEPEKSPERLKERLVQQLCSPVRWRSCVEYMLGAGVSTFVEIGPGKVLSGLIRRISREARIINLNDLSSISSLDL